MPAIQEGVEASFEKRPLGMPGLPVIKTETAKLGLPDSDAETIYYSWLANGFKNGRGRKIVSWTATIRTWYLNRYFPSQKLARPKTIDSEAAQLAKIRRMKNG